MCGVCGCGDDEKRIDGQPVVNPHDHRTHGHGTHDHGALDRGAQVHHAHGPSDRRHAGQGSHDHAHDHQPGRAGGDRFLRIEQEILSENDRFAATNRRWFAERAILALNLVSSPGAGKTSLLTETIRRLAGRLPVAVIEGDQETDNDAVRIREAGAAAIQINTGRGCHLDAHSVGHAAEHLDVAPGSVLFIENVGNLVCPAAFDLGEACKVAILSTTEGVDKPIKYPDMFAASELMLLNKIDLLPHLDFDVDEALGHARRVNPAIQAIKVSARSGAGLDCWIEWLEQRHRAVVQDRIDALDAKSADLRARLENLDQPPRSGKPFVVVSG
jgi:hydrogenase nickel incorporation protein HypB